MKHCRMAMAALFTITAVAARAEERLPTIPPAQCSEEQKQAAADFEAQAGFIGLNRGRDGQGHQQKKCEINERIAID
jgi:hypothetical protein